MTNTLRDLLISLASHMAYMQGQLEAHHEHDDPEDYYWYRESVLLRQKVTDELLADEPAVPEGREPAAVITEPSDEEGPSVEEVEELCEEHCFNVIGYESIERLQGLINEAIARWGNLKASLTSSPPADGEVAECAAELLQRQALMMAWKRLPEPGDCDAEGRCWWFCPPDFIELRSHTSAESAFVAGATHCLPAHALPLPEVGE